MSLYETLQFRAECFILSTSPKTPGTNTPNPSLFLSLLTPSFHMTFGHAFFVSTVPHLQQSLSGAGFSAHQAGMAAKLQTWSIRIRRSCVDVEKREVVVRAEFQMFVKGEDEPVVNDILFWIGLDEEGEQVAWATEYVDPAASAELARRMKNTAAGE